MSRTGSPLRRELTIVNCADSAHAGWRFLEDELADRGWRLRWIFHDGNRSSRLERIITRPNLARFRACWNCARDARRHRADLLITHLPRTTCWVAVFCWLLRVRTPHIAFSFNFTDLPGPTLRWIMTRSLRRVSRFVVFSSQERMLYSRHLSQPLDRFDYLPWSMTVPVPSPDEPLLVDGYVSVVGSEGRDLDVLYEAARRCPGVRFAVVSRLVTAEDPRPDNVVVFPQLSQAECWNIIQFSRFSVVPLRSRDTNCGHITVVASHLLGRAVIATRTIGLEDYVHDGSDGITVTAGSVEEVVDAVERLWGDPESAEALGRCGFERASERNRLDRWVDYLSDQLASI